VFPESLKGPPSAVGLDVIEEMYEVAQRQGSGAIIEVGVWKGGTAFYLARLAKQQERELWLYDTFQGIPYQEPGVDDHRPGDFGDTSLAQVREALPTVPPERIIAGIFPQTFVTPGEPISFAHIDCDQYRSVLACIDTLGPLMRKGGIMWFDDPSSLAGARQAMRERYPESRIELTRTKKWLVRY
jgi:O-methyltransferase